MTAWNIRPIASALWRNRTGAMLVAFQIAIGLAVLVNAVYVVKQRVDKIGRPTGMDTANMIWVASAGFAKNFDYEASWREDLATLRALPGVKAASVISNIPLSGGGSSSGFQAKPGEVDAQGDGAGQQLRRRRAGHRGARRQADRGTAVRGARDPAALGDLRDRRRRRSSPRRSPRNCSRRTRTRSARLSTTGSASRSRSSASSSTCTGAWVGWDKLDHVVLFPRIKNGPNGDLPRPDRAGPPRRRDARHRGEARRLEPRAACCAGCGRSTTSSTSPTSTTATWRSSW